MYFNWVLATIFWSSNKAFCYLALKPLGQRIDNIDEKISIIENNTDFFGESALFSGKLNPPFLLQVLGMISDYLVFSMMIPATRVTDLFFMISHDWNSLSPWLTSRLYRCDDIFCSWCDGVLQNIPQIENKGEMRRSFEDFEGDRVRELECFR